MIVLAFAISFNFFPEYRTPRKPSPLCVIAPADERIQVLGRDGCEQVSQAAVGEWLEAVRDRRRRWFGWRGGHAGIVVGAAVRLVSRSRTTRAVSKRRAATSALTAFAAADPVWHRTCIVIRCCENNNCGSDDNERQ